MEANARDDNPLLCSMHGFLERDDCREGNDDSHDSGHRDEGDPTDIASGNDYFSRELVRARGNLIIALEHKTAAPNNSVAVEDFNIAVERVVHLEALVTP